MRGHDLIRAERFRQESSEHHTQEKDVGRINDLAFAAVAYILGDEDKWPWETGFKPKTEKRNLIRAGALIAAAIDALQEEEKTYE